MIDQYDCFFPAELPLERRNHCSASGSYYDRRIDSVDLDEVNYHPLEKLLGGQRFHVVFERKDIIYVQTIQNLTQFLFRNCLANVLLAYLELQLNVAYVLRATHSSYVEAGILPEDQELRLHAVHVEFVRKTDTQLVYLRLWLRLRLLRRNDGTHTGCFVLNHVLSDVNDLRLEI